MLSEPSAQVEAWRIPVSLQQKHVYTPSNQISLSPFFSFSSYFSPNGSTIYLHMFCCCFCCYFQVSWWVAIRRFYACKYTNYCVFLFKYINTHTQAAATASEVEVSEDVDELIDLMRDKKSPWFELNEWTGDGDAVRHKRLRDNTTTQRLPNIHKNKNNNNNNHNSIAIDQCFSSLRLNDQNVIGKSQSLSPTKSTATTTTKHRKQSIYGHLDQARGQPFAWVR